MPEPGENGAEQSKWDQPLIIAEPDVQVYLSLLISFDRVHFSFSYYSLNRFHLLICFPKAINICEDDQFLLLGCDGLFDVYTPEEVVTFVKSSMEKYGDAQRCCQVIHILHQRRSRFLQLSYVRCLSFSRLSSCAEPHS